MPSLIKRGRKSEDSGPLSPPEAAQTDEPNGHAGAMPPEMAAPTRRAPEPPATYELPGTIEFDPPISFEPAPPPPDSPRYSGSLFQRALGEPGEQTPEERDRVAAAEFEQAIAPVLDMMRASVPGANTPEEAARILGENQGEVTPDPNGGSYVHGDAFDADARVYYRLLRRNYEKNPRPSEKKAVSHHLHAVYNRLPGTRGW